MADAIVFEHVRFAYADGLVVLDQLDLTIATGELFALVGRSGAGKSTLLRLVNRLALPANGRVLVDGRDTREWEPIALRRRIGFAQQDVGLFPHMTVAENIGLLGRIERWAADRIDRRVDELLTLVGLSATLRDRWPDELSGGQQQRVGVARALMLDPPALLMDEPFGALDPLTRLALRREFRRLQSTLRKSVILVTHDLREAFDLGDRIGAIDEGRLVACGTRDDLEQSSHPFVRDLMATVEPIDTASASRNSATDDRAARGSAADDGAAGAANGADRESKSSLTKRAQS
jgi:osmoprotectant transport system ATP-binding protein